MERWPQVKELFHAALEREPPGRAAFLAVACAGDASLRAEVESLLVSHEGDTGFLETPALEAFAEPVEAECGRTRRGRRIGAYELLDVVASGGMGTVYSAVRADDEYRKRVAVKLIRDCAGSDNPTRRGELLRRFRTERQTLANLDHPHIAKLLDGGTTDDGSPYLVMDYIEGLPIDAYCDAHGLSTPQRLDLFRTACSAVQYAHQNLVIHRDLKPGNILVTPEGVPKLLDFGIAKLFDPDSSDPAVTLTRTAAQPMTPAYASPEQIRGESITTASDVYSLGVVLYELLTGRPPYRLSSGLPHELAQAICEQEPERPSTAVTRVEQTPASIGSRHSDLTPEAVSRLRDGRPDRLRRRLAGDIDMILLKALRKEPQRRYASVEQFSEDIRRHLAGLPVIARPDTLAYRASKFLRRHALGAAAAAVMALLLAGATVMTARSAREAGRQRDAALQEQRAAVANLDRALQAEHQAATEAAKAEHVADYLVKIFQAADPFLIAPPDDRPRREITQRETLKRGVERIDADLKDQPEIQASLMHALGAVYISLADYEEAQRLLQRALQLRRQTLGENHLDVAASLNALGSLFRIRGDFVQAERLLRDALEMRTGIVGPVHALTAESLYGLARVREAQGELADAEGLYRSAIETYSRLESAAPPERANALSDYAALLSARGRNAEAEPYQREAVELLRSSYGDRHPAVAEGLMNLAHLLQIKKDFPAAEPLYREALNIYRGSLGDDHPFVATALSNLAGLLEEKGDPATAEPLLREALELLRRHHGPDHPSVASGMNNLAMTLQALDRFEEAEDLFRQTLQIRRNKLGSDHPQVALSLTNLGLLLHCKKEYAEAEGVFREAWDVRRAKLGDDHPRSLGTLHSLAVSLRALERYDEAEVLLDEELAIQRRTQPTALVPIAATLTEMGRVLSLTGDHSRALPLLEEALAIMQQTMPGDDWRVAETRGVLGECLTGLERYDEAESLLLESYRGLLTKWGALDERTIRAVHRLINLHEACGQSERVEYYRAFLPDHDLASPAGG